MFAPQQWGAVDIFQRFHGTTYRFSKHEGEALRGVANHFSKALRLERVSKLIAPLMQQDQDELADKGYTAGERSRDYTAVVEALITSLYSSVDCTRRVLRAVFPKAQGLPDSTRKLFGNAFNGKLDPLLPEAICNALASATWFTEFRVLRDALTHSDTGSCSLNPETGKIAYFHETFRGFREPGYIEDFVPYVHAHIEKVNAFLVDIYSALTQTLNDDEIWAMCGLFQGRVYSRFVRQSEAVDFDSGRCDAYQWFELEENPSCPFKETCGAYSRRLERKSQEPPRDV